MPKISIVIPCFNDIALGVLSRNLETYHSINNLEIICVDGGSSDGTIELIKSFDNVKLISHSGSRISLINQGLKIANGEYILIHHPRSWIRKNDFNLILELENKSWGALTHRFDQTNPILNFTSWYSNYIRGDLFYIYYLDHCIYIHQSLIQKFKEFKDVEIFEDTEMCKTLRKICYPIRLNIISTTSSVRFKKNGLFKQVVLNQIMKIMYYLNCKPETMNKIYELGLNLNSK